MNSESEAYLPVLYRLLLGRFDREELVEICFLMNIDYDDLRGEGRAGKIRELLLYLARRDELPALLATLREVRADDEWPPVPAGFRSANQHTAVEIERFQKAARDPERPAAAPGVNAPQFNISGKIQAGKVNIGGVETIHGDQQINLDFSETNDEASSDGDG